MIKYKNIYLILEILKSVLSWYLCNRSWYWNKSLKIGFFIVLQTRNNKFNQYISPQNNTITHVNTNIDKTCTLHKHSQLDNSIQFTYHNIQVFVIKGRYLNLRLLVFKLHQELNKYYANHKYIINIDIPSYGIKSMMTEFNCIFACYNFDARPTYITINILCIFTYLKYCHLI